MSRSALLSATAATVLFACVLVPRILDEENGPGDYSQGWWACYASRIVGDMGDGEPPGDMRANYFPVGLPLLVAAVDQVVPLRIATLPLLNFPFILMAFYACYYLAHDLGGRRVALCSLLCLAAHPMVLTATVEFGPPAATMGLTGLAMVGLRAIRDSGVVKAMLLGAGVGLAVGAGLFFDRLVVIPMVLPALTYVLVTSMRSKRWPALLGLATAIAAAAYMGGHLLMPWLEDNFSAVTEGMGIEAEDRAGEQVQAPLWDIRSLTFYPLVWFEGHAGPLVAALAIIGVTAARSRASSRTGTWNWGYVITSLVGAWVLMTLLQKKQTYYTLSVLPASGALAGAGLAWLMRRRAIAVVVALLLVNQVVFLTYGSRVKRAECEFAQGKPVLATMHWIGLTTGAITWTPAYLRSFGPFLEHRPSGVHMGQIAAALQAEDLFEPGSTLALYQDHPRYNDDMMLAEFRLACHTNQVVSPVSAAMSLLAAIDEVDYAVFITQSADLDWPVKIDPDVIYSWHISPEEAHQAFLSLGEGSVKIHETTYKNTRAVVWKVNPGSAW